MYKVVFIDMDGTLLKADHSVSEETRATLQHLRDQGVLIVLVSARPYHGIIATHAWLGIEEFPVASLNGSYITSIDEVLFSSTISDDYVAKIHELAGRYKTTLLYYSGMRWFSEIRNWATDKEELITDVELVTDEFENLRRLWNTDGIAMNKLMGVGDPADVQLLQQAIRDSFDGAITAYTSKPTYLEIMPKNASKALAIQYVCDRYNINISESIAFGDNYNDVEMLKRAGRGVAMGNAPDDIKAIADAVTETNQEDGVRRELERQFGGIL